MLHANREDRARADDLVTIAMFSEYIVDMGDSPGAARWLERAGVPLRLSGYVLLRALELAGTLTLSQLAEQVGLQPSTVCVQLKPLLEAHLVSRRADRADRRVANIMLTSAGKKVCAACHAAAEGEWRKLLASWPREDRRRLGELVARVSTESEAFLARLPHLGPLPPSWAGMASENAGEEYLRAIVGWCERISDLSFAPNAARYVLGGLGAELPQSAFVLLRRLEGRASATPSDLADELGVDQSTVSQQLRPLFEKQLVQRSADPSDRRIAQLTITNAGRRLCGRIRALGAEAWDDILARWSAKERRELATLLDRVMADAARLRA